jgi:hypothetical protein
LPTQSTRKPPPAEPVADIPPYVRDYEEMFVSSLGWALHLNGDRDGRFDLAISTALGIDPSAFRYSELRELFVAIRDTYLSDDAFTWPAVRKSLWRSGWFTGGLGGMRWTVFLDIVTNRFTTVSALPSIRESIEEHAAGERRVGGYQ